MGEDSDDIELIEQRELDSVPPQFVERFFGLLAAELGDAILGVPGHVDARRVPLQRVGTRLSCLVVRVDVREAEATVELTTESFDDARPIAEPPDRARLVATIWRAAEQSARPDALPS